MQPRPWRALRRFISPRRTSGGSIDMADEQSRTSGDHCHPRAKDVHRSMGQLVDGVWQPGWYQPKKSGAFERPATTYRDGVSNPSTGRYHLYVARACPWAQRTLITRSLRGLDHAVSVTVVDPHMGEDGWAFKTDDPDPIGPSKFLRDVYLRGDPQY